MIYVLAYPDIAPAPAQRIDQFRRAHEPDRAKLVPPHITLVFGVQGQHQAVVLRRCHEVARSSAPFAIEFSRCDVVYDPFEKTYKLFLMCALGKDALTDLHNRLYDGPHRAELNTDIPYQPHMTVATNPDRAAIERLDLGDLGPLPIAGTIRALEVVALRDGKLRALDTVPLGRASAP